jgi:hypothetical protein
MVIVCSSERLIRSMNFFPYLPCLALLEDVIIDKPILSSLIARDI